MIPNRQEENAGSQKAEDSQDQEEEDQEEEEGAIQMKEEWKGLTAFQIRQILKQERKKQRQQKKAEMTTEQYIKKALHKKKGPQRTPCAKGNYGAKAKNKAKSQSIK